MKNFIQLSELVSILEKRDELRLGGTTVLNSEYLQLCTYADFNFDNGAAYGFGKINIGLSPGMEGWYGEVHHDLKYFPIVYVDRLEVELNNVGIREKVKDIFTGILGPAYEVESPGDEPENIIIRNKQGFEARCDDKIPYFDPEEERD